MATDKEIINQLNAILRNELTAISQYFLHARMLKHMGFMKLADHEYKKSIDEMKHADMLIERVLVLKGVPCLQGMEPIVIGENVADILEQDLKLEQKANDDVKAAIAACEAKKDAASASTLRRILASEEEHALFLHTQLAQIASLGAPAYMQTQR